MQSNNFETILNECALYVWEWNVPMHNVRFGVPSLEGLWMDDQKKLFKLVTVLERVHPDDISKIFVSRNSPLYKSNEMFQIDLRLRLGRQAVGYEWFCIRGKVISRDDKARPVMVHGVAINADQRYRAVMRLIESKNRQSRLTDQHREYFGDMIHEVETFLLSLAQNADTLIHAGQRSSSDDLLGRLSLLKGQVEHLMDYLDRFRGWTGNATRGTEKDNRLVPLWEHLAELLQVYCLSRKTRLHLQLDNPYDNVQVCLNVRVFDLLLENVVNAQLRNSRDGNLLLHYQLQDDHTLLLSVKCDNPNPLANLKGLGDYSEEALGLGVCRLLAGRIHAQVDVRQDKPSGPVSYVIQVPLVSRTTSAAVTRLKVLDEPAEPVPAEHPAAREAKAVPVLMGLTVTRPLLAKTNLFCATQVHTSDEVIERCSQLHPEILFLDDQLTGGYTLPALLSQLAADYPDLPLIVVSDDISRTNRHRVEQLGAQYLIKAPLTVNKVNTMIRRYLH